MSMEEQIRQNLYWYKETGRQKYLDKARALIKKWKGLCPIPMRGATAT